MTTNGVAIIGAGKLGTELSELFLSKGLKHWCTKRELSSPSPPHYLAYDWEQDSLPVEISSCDTVILTIPPSSANYVRSFNFFLQQTTKSNMIFLSSISVYGNAQGTVTEQTPTAPETSNAKKIVEAEGLLRQSARRIPLILRLGGLVSKTRHPIFTLQGKRMSTDGKAPINLVHHNDVNHFIYLSLLKNIEGVYNVVAPFHPMKRDFYPSCAQKLGLAPPVYDQNAPGASGKIVSGSLIAKKTNRSYEVRSLDSLCEFSQS